MAKVTPWTYYYEAKRALELVKAYFAFNDKEDVCLSEFEEIEQCLRRIGELISEVNGFNES